MLVSRCSWVAADVKFFVQRIRHLPCRRPMPFTDAGHTGLRWRLRGRGWSSGIVHERCRFYGHLG